MIESKQRRSELQRLRRKLKVELTMKYFLEVVLKAEKLDYIEY